MKLAKILLSLLGTFAGMGVVWQLMTGIIMAERAAVELRSIHRYAGYATAALALVYIALSVAAILNLPSSAELREATSEMNRPDQ